jgi:hypothetical protein
MWIDVNEANIWVLEVKKMEIVCKNMHLNLGFLFTAKIIKGQPVKLPFIILKASI